MTATRPSATEPAVHLRAVAGSARPLVGGGPRAWSLAHGESPADLLAREGLRLDRLVAAAFTGEHELTLSIEVDDLPAATTAPRPPDRVRRDPDVRDAELAGALRRRRIAAYALIRDEDRVLLTVLSDKARAAPGAWTLPGGGVDPGEQPAEAVLREVWEETGQRVEGLELIGVTTDHWIGRAPDGTLEDFQPIRLLYRATCPNPSEPVVHDLGGTTASAAWVPVREVLRGSAHIVRSWAGPLRAHL